MAQSPGQPAGLLPLSPATAVPLAAIQGDLICCSLSASPVLCWDYVPGEFHLTEELFSSLPSSVQCLRHSLTSIRVLAHQPGITS